MKKFRITFFAILLMALAMPQSVLAFDFSSVAPTGQTLYYNIVNGSAELVRPGTGSEYNNYVIGDLVIPSIVAYDGSTYMVTALANVNSYGSFDGCSGLTSVTIPGSVTSIGEYAFYGCSGLTSVTIPNSVTSIGANAFYGCSGLTAVTISNSVTSIGAGAFEGCSGLTSVTIPESVTSIGEYAFAGCSGLTTVNYNADSCTSMGWDDNRHLSYPVFEGCSNITTLTIGENVTIIPSQAFSGCSGLTTVNFNATNCTHMDNEYQIGLSLFSNLNITTLNIGENVTSIPNNAFSYCSGLTSVTIPGSVTSIGVGAFGGCSGLTSVTISNGVITIGQSAFGGCSSLTTITIPNSVTSIGVDVFWGCRGLTSVTIPNSVTLIGEGAFTDCSGLTSVTIPNSVTSIGVSTFSGCSGLTSVTIPESVTSIGEGAFYECSGLTSVTIPGSVTSIGEEAFRYCSGLTSVTIPNSVTSIGASAFFECTNLASVVVGNGVDTIGYLAFGLCTSLDTLIMLSETAPVISSNTFQAVRTNVPIFVPCGASDAYNEAAYWNVFTRIQEADSCNSNLTLAVNNSNLGSVRGAGMYRPGRQVEIMAVPMAGSQFVRWNDANTNNPRTITINSDTTFTAFFDTVAAATVYHNVTVTSSNMAMGSGMGGGSYAHGTVATIVAVPADGYAFSNWHDGNTTNPRSITVTENNFFIASFVVSSTVVQHDTTYVDNYIHDTTYVDNYIHDTTYVDNYIYDTTYIDNYIHDTTYVDNYIHDTTYVDNYIHDTTYVDNYIHDTTYVDNYIHDTTYIDNYIYDTTYVDNWIYDTTYVTDTLWMTEYDTIWLHDTIIIHDTIYIGQEGIDNVAGNPVKVYSSRGQIVVEGAEGNTVTLYDAVGRQLAVRRDEHEEVRFDVQATGAYFIRVGNQPAKRIVAIR